MKILLFGNTYRSEAVLSALQLVTFLQNKHVDVWVENSFYEFLKNQKLSFPDIYGTFDTTPEKADFALSLGGDGTFLNTAMHIGALKIPILGINMGRLGFLADVADNEMELALNKIITDQYVIEERTVLELQTTHQNWSPSSFALNEIAILKQDSSSMIAIQVRVNGEELNTYRSDGLIIATPTGSTAYSMSVGGPIVVPQANNFILAPVASHSLNIRPLIIPDNWELEFQVQSRNNSFLVALDGRSAIFDHNEKLSIRKADYTIRVVKQTHHTFFNTLKNKLMWGVDKRVENFSTSNN